MSPYAENLIRVIAIVVGVFLAVPFYHDAYTDVRWSRAWNRDMWIALACTVLAAIGVVGWAR